MPQTTVDPLTGEAFRRVVGARPRPPAGEFPNAEARAAHGAMADYRTGAPKGVFRYQSHEEANADRERWLVATARQVERLPRT
ncbi:MAG: hypothetical protein R3B13_15755 [Polyangiaceae bacterium]